MHSQFIFMHVGCRRCVGCAPQLKFVILVVRSPNAARARTCAFWINFSRLFNSESEPLLFTVSFVRFFFLFSPAFTTPLRHKTRNIWKQIICALLYRTTALPFMNGTGVSILFCELLFSFQSPSAVVVLLHDYVVLYIVGGRRRTKN